MSHYDSNTPGQYRPRPQPNPFRPPRKRKMPLLGKIALIIGGTIMLVIGGCTALVTGAGLAEQAADDPAPVVSTQTPLAAPTKPSTKPTPAVAPAKTQDERFTEQVRKQFPVLAAMGDDTMIQVAKSACAVFDAGESWESVVELIGEAAPGSEAEVTGVIRTGVAIYCPKHNDKTGGPGAKKPSKPTMTTSQEQAVGAAQDYLRVSAFSRAALIDQLTSEYGSGFSKADATFAVDYLKTDWYAQAVKSAKAYLRVSHFSRAGLIKQLESEYGGQFTHAQAVHGAKGAGL